MYFLSVSVPVCETDPNCQIPKCLRNRWDTLKLYQLRWLSFRLLLESIHLAEHFVVNHLLSARYPDRSKLQFRYLCYRQLIDLIRRTVHQVLTNGTFTCSHVTLPLNTIWREHSSKNILRDNRLLVIQFSHYIFGSSLSGNEWKKIDSVLFRWFKFTLKPPYSIMHGKLQLAIWDTSFWTFWLKFGHKGP